MSDTWKDHFDERQLAEIDLARHYAKNPHGTDGHHRLLIIAKMADLLSGGLVPAVVKQRDVSQPVRPHLPPIDRSAHD
jgi:hypothetical protein